MTTRIILANRSNGPDQVMDLVEQRCDGEFGDVAEVLSAQELHDTASSYKQLVGTDIDGLNARPSIL